MVSSESLRVPSCPSDGVRVLANILHSHSLRVRWPSSQDLFQALPLNLVYLSVSSFWFQGSWTSKVRPKGSGYMFFKKWSGGSHVLS